MLTDAAFNVFAYTLRLQTEGNNIHECLKEQFEFVDRSGGCKVNARGRIVPNLSGHIEMGLFFHLFAESMDEISMAKEMGELGFLDNMLLVPPVSRSECIQTELQRSVADSVSLNICPFHPERIDVKRIVEATVDVQVGTNSVDSWSKDSIAACGIWGNRGDGYLYVSPHVQDVLSREGLCGTRFAPCEFLTQDELPFFMKHSRVLCFDGRSIERAYAVLPNAENHCSRCGFSPIVCPNCPEVFYVCPVCQRRLIVSPRDKAELILNLGGLNVVDLTLWDGSDFLGGNYPIVTGRVLDLLISLHIAPFGAIALGCYTAQIKESMYASLRSTHYKDWLLGPPTIEPY